MHPWMRGTRTLRSGGDHLGSGRVAVETIDCGFLLDSLSLRRTETSRRSRVGKPI